MVKAETLAEARRAKDPELTQEQVATLLKCSQPHVCRIESGEVEPSYQEMRKMMKLYGIRSQKEFWRLFYAAFLLPLWQCALDKGERMETFEVLTLPTLAERLHTKRLEVGWLKARNA